MFSISKVSPRRRQEFYKDFYKLIVEASHCISTDADDYVRPQRQLEQLVPGAGAEDPLHGAKAGRAESLLPSDLQAALPGPPSAQHRDQVKPLAAIDTQSQPGTYQSTNSFAWCSVGDKAEELLILSAFMEGPLEPGCKSSAADSKHRRPLGGRAFILKISTLLPCVECTLHWDSQQ